MTCSSGRSSSSSSSGADEAGHKIHPYSIFVRHSARFTRARETLSRLGLLHGATRTEGLRYSLGSEGCGLYRLGLGLGASL